MDVTASLFDDAAKQGEAALLELVHRLRERGLSQADVYLYFEDYRRSRNAVLFEGVDDVLLDVMDRVVGYCSESSRLFDTYLSNQDIEAARSFHAELSE